jgi:branched-chain amino acid transport system substrate-binding protein
MGWKSLAVLVTALLAAELGASQPSPCYAEEGVTDDTVRIGGLGALTGPGYLYGKVVMDGAEAVYKDVNDAGGIAGRKIVYVRQDDRCDPASAIAAAKKLIFDDKVFMIHGGGCTNASIAAYPTIKEANVPWVIFASVGDLLTAPPAPYIFSTALTASIESYAQLAFARERGAKNIAIVSQRDAWGRDRYDRALEAFNKAGLKPVADEEVAADSNEATPQVLRIQQAGADAIIMILYPKAAAAFLRDAFKVGYKPLIAGQTALGDVAVLGKQVGIPNALDNFFAISHVRYTPGDEASAKWQALLSKYYPNEPLQIFQVLGIGSAKVVVEVLQRVGRDLTRERFKATIQQLANFDTGIIPGPITCTETDHQCDKTPAWVALKDGKIVTVATTTVKK